MILVVLVEFKNLVKFQPQIYLNTYFCFSEEKIKKLGEDITNYEKERDELRTELSALKDELAEAQLSLEASKNDNEKLQVTIKK